MNNPLLYCGLVDAKTSASEKNLPLLSSIRIWRSSSNYDCFKIQKKIYIRTFQKNLCKYMNNPIQHASTTTLYYLLLCSSTIGKLLAIYRQFLLPPLATTIVLQGHPWQSVTLLTIISSKFVVSLSMFQGYGILSKHFLFKKMSHSLNSVYFSWPKI